MRALLLLLLPLTANADYAVIDPFFVSPWPDQPWWAWPASPDGKVVGPCDGREPGLSSSGLWRYRYDKEGRLIEADHNSEVEELRTRIEWDNRGPIREIHSRVWAESSDELQRITFVRDAKGRVVEKQIEDRLHDPRTGVWAPYSRTGTVRYRYDDKGQIVSSETEWAAFFGHLTRVVWERGKGQTVRLHEIDLEEHPQHKEEERAVVELAWSSPGQLQSLTRVTRRRELWKFHWAAPGKLEGIEASVDRNGGFDAAFRYQCK